MARRRLVVTRARDFSTRPEPSRRGLALVLVAAFVFAAAAQQAWSARSALEDARLQVDAERRSMGDLKERLTRRRPGVNAEAVTARVLAAQAAPPSRVLGEVAGLLPPGVRLEGLAVTYARGIEVDLSVVARGPRDYDDFVERLARSPRFTSLEPGAERREGEVRATVRAAYLPVGEP